MTEQLPRRADEVFKGAAGDVHAALEQELAGLAERVRQEIDADALTPTGDINTEYRQQKAKAALRGAGPFFPQILPRQCFGFRLA